MEKRKFDLSVKPMWTIYAVKHDITKRVYVGCTERPIKFRYQAHMAALRSHRHPSGKMQEDFDNFGEHFSLINLESGEDKPLWLDNKLYRLSSLKEKGWMKKLGSVENGYNQQDILAKRMIESGFINFEDYVK